MADQEDVDEIKSKVAALARFRFGDSKPASIKKLFSQYDTDKNQLASDFEIARLFDDAGVDITRLGVSVGNLRVARAVIEEMDKNADRQIAWDEYKAYMGIVEVEPVAPGGGGSGTGGTGKLPSFEEWKKSQEEVPVAQVSKKGAWGYWPWVGLGAAVAGYVYWRRRN